MNLVFVERRYPIDNHPRQTPPKIDKLVHEEAHDARREDIVADVRVPGGPEAFEVVELDIVLADLMELMPVGVLSVREHDIRDCGVVGAGAAGRNGQQLRTLLLKRGLC